MPGAAEMPALDDLVASAVRGFGKRFGRRPRFAAAAPGRVNLVGEHTDYNDGYALPFAIDRWAVVVADQAAGAVSRLWSIDLDEEITTDLTAPLAPIGGCFADYLVGVAAGFGAQGRPLANLDVALRSSVPIGAGLASSAAVEVAMARLLAETTGTPLAPLEVARLCQDAEHGFAGTPCGIMDMLVAADAREGDALLIDFRTLSVRPVPLPAPDEAVLLVVDTKVRHELATSAYATRRRDCAAAAAAMGLESLRDADLPGLARCALPREHERLARHVIEENQRTLLASAALATGDLDALGELMFQSHESLRDLYRVSCRELDTVVEVAFGLRGPEGAIGARMTGGGFGGCAIVLVRPAGTAALIESLREHFAARFGHEPDLHRVRAVGPATLTLPR